MNHVFFCDSVDIDCMMYQGVSISHFDDRYSVTQKLQLDKWKTLQNVKETELFVESGIYWVNWDFKYFRLHLQYLKNEWVNSTVYHSSCVTGI